MSMVESVEKGYGVSIAGARNTEKLKEILMHEEWNDSLVNEFVNTNTTEELIRLYEENVDEDVATALAFWLTKDKTINPKEIRFDGYPAFEEAGTEETVMFGQGYPWTMTENEKRMTKEELNAILIQFANELGIDTNEICYQELHYFG